MSLKSIISNVFTPMAVKPPMFPALYVGDTTGIVYLVKSPNSQIVVYLPPLEVEGHTHALGDFVSYSLSQMTRLVPETLITLSNKD